MEKALIIQSNGAGKQELSALLDEGWRIKTMTVNNGPSYNDLLVVVERD